MNISVRNQDQNKKTITKAQSSSGWGKTSNTEFSFNNRREQRHSQRAAGNKTCDIH